jgi:hypothetical protein
MRVGVGWARNGGGVSVRVREHSVEMSFELRSSGAWGAVVESSLCSKRDRSVFSCLSKVRS